MTCLARRSVLKGAAAACGVGLLSACGAGGEVTDDASVPVRQDPVDGAAGALARVDDIPDDGALAATAPDGSKVLLTRTGSDVRGFSAVCPHEGCTVAPDDGQLTCPCHGSQFELSGDLKRGPARTGLTAFAVRVVDGDVLPA